MSITNTVLVNLGLHVDDRYGSGSGRNDRNRRRGHFDRRTRCHGNGFACALCKRRRGKGDDSGNRGYRGANLCVFGHYEGSTNGRPLWARTFDKTRVTQRWIAAEGANTAHFCPMRRPKILLDDDHAGSEGLREGTAEKAAVSDVEAMEIVRTKDSGRRWVSAASEFVRHPLLEALAFPHKFRP